MNNKQFHTWSGSSLRTQVNAAQSELAAASIGLASAVRLTLQQFEGFEDKLATLDPKLSLTTLHLALAAYYDARDEFDAASEALEHQTHADGSASKLTLDNIE